MEDKNKAIWVGYNQHDCETFYKCPHCGVVFGDWLIFFQKQKGEKTHCPHCNKPLIVGD